MSQFDEDRRTGIGGSDAPVALGLSPWSTPYDLFLAKTGQGDEPPPPTEPMIWGTLMQPVIAAEYARRTGFVLVEEPAMLRHPTNHWMIGHLDGSIVDSSPRRILEVKTARDGRGWGEPGTDEIPLHYLLQCHHYLIVSGAEICDVAILISGSDFRIYRVAADPEIAALLIAQEGVFWRHVEEREPPPPIHLADAVRRWGRLACPGSVTADRIELLAIEELRRIQVHRSTLNLMEETNRAIVMQALADKGEALVDATGTLLATWKLDGGRKGYAVAERPPQRRFMLK